MNTTEPQAVPTSRPWRPALCAAAIHLALSAGVIAIVAALIYGLWFPTPYRRMLGGDKLFLLIAWVDVSLGPLLTLVVFDVRKLRRELVRDLGVIGLLQASALAYGTATLLQARPVHLAFEVDLYRIVTVADVDPTQLPEAPEALRQLPWTGPILTGVRRPTDAREIFNTALLGARGIHLAYLPRYWQPYASVLPQVQAKARPMAELRLRSAPERAQLDETLARSGLSREQARWLPVLSARASWIAIVDEQAQPRAFAAIDSF